MRQPWGGLVFSYSDVLKIKYKDRTCSLSECDCFGLVKLLYQKDHGIILPDYHKQFEGVYDGENELVKKGHWERIDSIDSFPSIIVMSMFGGRIDHVGYNISRFQFIHIRKSIGYPIITKIHDLQYKHKIKGFYRYVE